MFWQWPVMIKLRALVCFLHPWIAGAIFGPHDRICQRADKMAGVTTE